MLQRIITAFSHLPGVRDSALYDGSGELIVGVAGSIDHSALRRCGERVARDLGLGALEEIWVESAGAVVIAPVGEAETLCIHLDDATSIGRASHELRRTRPIITELLR